MKKIILKHNVDVLPELISNKTMYDLYKQVTKRQPDLHVHSMMEGSVKLYKPFSESEQLSLSPNTLTIIAPDGLTMYAESESKDVLEKIVAIILRDAIKDTDRLKVATRPKPASLGSLENTTLPTNVDKSVDNDDVLDLDDVKRGFESNNEVVKSTEDGTKNEPIMIAGREKPLHPVQKVTHMSNSELEQWRELGKQELERQLIAQEKAEFANRELAKRKFNVVNKKTTLLDRFGKFLPSIVTRYGGIKKEYHSTKVVDDGVNCDFIMIGIKVDNSGAKNPLQFINEENTAEGLQRMLDNHCDGAAEVVSVSFDELRGIYTNQFVDLVKMFFGLVKMGTKLTASKIKEGHKIKPTDKEFQPRILDQ